MGNNTPDSNIRKRLIDAGLKELLEHGSADFSLRRVAQAAQVSCAAPYRHFKDKDELVRAVIAQIRENWILLAEEIGRIFPLGSPEHITELLVACVRFFVAGDNFAPFLIAGEIAEFDEPIITSVECFARESALDDEARSALVAALLAEMYGTVTLVISGRLGADYAVARLKAEAADRLRRVCGK